METISDPHAECPAVEDLSAWFDGENQDQSLVQHLESCDACNKRIDDYRRINATISVFTEVDGSFVDRVHSGCVEDIKTTNSGWELLAFPAWLKIAAVIILVGAVVFSQRSVNAPTTVAVSTAEGPVSSVADISNVEATNSEFPNADSKTTNRPEVVNALAVAARPDSAAELVRAANDQRELLNSRVRDIQRINNRQRRPEQGGLDYADISLVGYSNGHNRTSSVGVGARKASQTIGDYVHHVWVVKDPTSPLQALKKILPSDSDVIDNLIQENQNRYHLQFRIIDSQLQSLVNHFDQIGGTLLSPTPPQPCAPGEFNFSGNIVQYEVDFVRE